MLFFEPARANRFSEWLKDAGSVASPAAASQQQSPAAASAERKTPATGAVRGESGGVRGEAGGVRGEAGAEDARETEVSARRCAPHVCAIGSAFEKG